ncbi:tyrosine-type recombinase/integrase [Variovorax fucosicus]|uniref:tyrosine-type recombinase/integrase n=1 Tax=Variovorax fucosicus TaxID=3053517 RepID=UPI0025757CB4|nr:tyrosine-type recombinase/integrase [Variovorax sp. J22G47]MDM0057355.1 tyrosine-type recombinase/integrase [Variovorax sp. J22G47]
MNDEKSTKIRALSESLARTLGPGDYQDEDTRVLRFYVSDKGARSFGVYMWSPVTGKPMRKSIGRWPMIHVTQARAIAREWAEKVRKGEPLGVGKLKSKGGGATLGELVKDYTKELQQEKRASWWWVERTILGNAGSYRDWANLPLTDITRSMINERHRLIAFGAPEAGVKARGPAAASTALKALRAVFAYAIKNEKYTGVNTAKLVDKEPANTRERVLTPKEYEAILKVLDSEYYAVAYPHIRTYFRLLMLTGARKANMAAARWEDLDLEGHVWRIPAPNSKNRKPLEVHLTQGAVELFESQRGKDDEWVFPSPAGAASGHIEDMLPLWKQVLKIAGVKTDLTIHDIRRSFGSLMLNADTPMEVVAKLLGHRNAATTAKHYAFLKGSTVAGHLNRVLG